MKQSVRNKRRILLVLLLALAFLLAACGKKKGEEATASSGVSAASTESIAELPTNTPTAEPTVTPTAAPMPAAEPAIDKDGSYTSKDEVALYIHTYGSLPNNYITKKKAEELGWKSSEGNLWEVAPGMSIGGSRFGNYEGLLPDGDYRECDIDYEGGYRNAKRIVYSTDGRVYYTEDHYNTFEQLYPET